jgi:HSP90 family molecular chaperone
MLRRLASLAVPPLVKAYVPLGLSRPVLSKPLHAFTAARGFSERREFKAETRNLLDIVAKSLYKDREVFLRELVANANDALEKARILALTSGAGSEELAIRVEVDEAARRLVVADGGVGMSAGELDELLGTIAKSDSKAFKVPPSCEP